MRLRVGKTISVHGKEIHMEKTIKWEKDFDRVLTLARAEKKMVLLDFFNPL
jgi:hypothetical protein